MRSCLHKRYNRNGVDCKMAEEKTNWLVNGAASRLRADADQPLATAPNVARKSYLSRDLNLTLKATNGAAPLLR